MMIRQNSRVLFFSFLTVIMVFFACENNENITYFDVNWNETTKEHAAYFRTAPIRENNIWHIRDFYISGEKQFIGQTKDSLATIFEGDVTWYFKSGKVESKIRYDEGKQVGRFVTVEGAIGSDEEGWNEADLYHYGDLSKAVDAQKGSTDVYKSYYTNTSILAEQHTSNVDYDDKFSFTTYYNKSGETIGRLDYNEKSDKWEGKEVVFYETEREGRDEMNSIKTIITYEKGLVKHIQYYNTDEEKIASGSIKNELPFTGSFYRKTCGFYKVQQYEDGQLLQESIFSLNNEKLGEVSFKNEAPYTGVFGGCAGLQTYKNGKLDGASVKYASYKEDGSLDRKTKFGFKNGLKQGDYVIYDGEGFLLEKGTYKNDVQVGEVWYYHNGEAIEEGDSEHFYYLKANVAPVNNKPFISGFSQFSLDDKLINTFEFEPNTTDEFSYIDNGFHFIHLEDLNGDGFDDLQVIYRHQEGGFLFNTYYLFNSATKKYQHIAELDDVATLETNVFDKTITKTIRDYLEGQTRYITYSFSKNKLLRKLEVEEVYHVEKDTTFITQIFPVPVKDFPLLAKSLPPLTFVQQNVEQQITNAHQSVSLKKAPFSIVFPGLINRRFPHDFNVKVTASYDQSVFEKAKVGQREEDTDIFGIISAFARDPSLLIIAEDGHNLFYYDDTEYATLDLMKNINEDVLLLQFDIDKVHNGGEEKVISEINKPIYMIIYMDKNENKKIDTNELFYVTINL